VFIPFCMVVIYDHQHARFKTQTFISSPAFLRINCMNLRIVERANQLLEEMKRRDSDSVDKMSRALKLSERTFVKGEVGKG
jgi:hypothetical protein